MNVKNVLQRPKVSIVVPIYGVEPWLRQCLDSIVAQTLKEIL
jgi:glycosyltransferase involved in cell wall biosynthesis